MPELPEVETVMRGLSPVMLKNSITSVTLNRKDLRIPFNRGFKKDLEGQKINALFRRAKYILIELDNKKLLAIHLGMSGRVTMLSKRDTYEPQKHDHVVFDMKDGARIIYNDPRRFGMMFTLRADQIETHKAFAHLGPEPLSNNFSGTYLKEKLKNKQSPIKQAILDQTNVVGVGNIYACEALYMARISPTKKCSAISRAKYEELAVAIRDVLSKAIKAGGSTLKDFRHADGELGYFQHNFTVYDQEGQACASCKKKIKRIVQSGRSTFYCSGCQK